jgi:hypothetical protein
MDARPHHQQRRLCSLDFEFRPVPCASLDRYLWPWTASTHPSERCCWCVIQNECTLHASAGQSAPLLKRLTPLRCNIKSQKSNVKSQKSKVKCQKSKVDIQHKLQAPAFLAAAASSSCRRFSCKKSEMSRTRPTETCYFIDEPLRSLNWKGSFGWLGNNRKTGAEFGNACGGRNWRLRNKWGRVSK